MPNAPQVTGLCFYSGAEYRVQNINDSALLAAKAAAAAHRCGDWSGKRPTVIENSANVDLTNGDL